VRRWFEALSVHRKLVAVALTVSTVALLVALMGLTLFDVWRYRTRAAEDAATLASMIAETSAAAVTFLDDGAAAETLSTVRIRSEVRRACIFLPDGELLAAYARGPQPTCASAPPVANDFFGVGARVPIVRNGRTWGSVYVERDLSGLAGRIGMTASVAALMLLLSGALALFLAGRLTRGISGPISRLAVEARRVGQDLDFSFPEIQAPPDEVGDLVRAFRTMIARVHETNTGLRHEIEERRKVEAEREDLLEREREASRKKDEFVATVSHELRTPLGAILAWTQILEAGPPDERTLSKAVSTIARSAEAQARVIEDLVDVSRIASGKLHLQWGDVDLRTSIDAAVEVVRPAAAEKNVRIRVDEPDHDCPMKGDDDRLRQVFGNLLANAVKFSDEGGTVSVAVEDLGTSYEVTVRDEGVGIAADVLPYVFDRYRQADSSTTRRFGGLGLGLAIVKEVTELHGGSAAVESEGEGRGATFRVRLPALIGPRPERAAEAREGEGEVERLDGVEVLAVDDNPDALDALTIALGNLGAVVRTARSGPEALESWEADPPDIVLCDLAMPGMDGFDVLVELRYRGVRSSRPVTAIAVSAHATLEHRRRSREAGFVEHISKPYRVADVARAVNEALAVESP
jgi:signal transduction histidine kinase/CheY-like chemotaxis protein